MAIKDLSLKALREQINAGTREVSFKTDDGATSQMVYIPKFRVPTGSWEAGSFPAEDMLLGGFFIDKYQASHKLATDNARGIAAGATVTGADVAVSMPGKVLWDEITFNSAKTACANRKINGVACHLVTMKEWATVCFLTKLLGHDIRGNNDWGKDYRDANVWENYGIADPALAGYNQANSRKCSRVLTGTGPVSWSHNGMASGVYDIVGNVYEWVNFLITDGRYQAVTTGTVSDIGGVSAAATAIVIKGVQDPELWPMTNGLVLIKAEGSNADEYISYNSFMDNTNGTYTISGCLRAQKSTVASAHAADAVVQRIVDYCIIPGGWSAKVNDTGLNNTTNPTTFAIADRVSGPGNAVPQIGDVLQCEKEQLTVTVVNGLTITATRGTNGSPIAAHLQNVGIVKISPQMSNATPTTDPYQASSFLTMRTDSEMAPMGLPLTVGTATEEWKDYFGIRPCGQRAAIRGGNWSLASNARSGFLLDLIDAPSYRSFYIGFRAALSLG